MQISRFGFYWLDTWVMANVIQLATQDFCSRFLNHSNDPCGRQFDQMTQAARSAPANIAEGNSRHSTGQRLPELAAEARTAAVVNAFGRIQRGGKRQTRQARLSGRCPLPKQHPHLEAKASLRQVAAFRGFDDGG